MPHSLGVETYQLQYYFLFYYSTVEPKHAETAGTMMAFMLIIGLGIGAGFSFVITMFL